jgi:hypothetical protein
MGNSKRMEKEKYTITTEMDNMPVQTKTDFGAIY